MGVDGRDDRLFIVLVPGVQGEATAEGLRAGVPGASVLTPPTTGLAFFTCGGEEARGLDAWWAESGLADTRPVLVAAHEDDLADWLRGVDADLVVAVPGEEARDDYTGLPGVLSVITADPRELAHVALQAHAGGHARAGSAGSAETGAGRPGTDPPRQAAWEAWRDAQESPAEDSGWRRAEPGRSRRTTAADDPFAILSQVPSLYAGQGPPAAIEPIVVQPEPPARGTGDRDPDEVDTRSEPSGPPTWYTDAEYTWEPDPQTVPEKARPEGGATDHATDHASHHASHHVRPGNGWSAQLSLAELVGLLSDAGEAYPGFPGDGVSLEHPPLCIAVVSPEGGITRSASATAQAVILGEAVRPLQATVGLVDAVPGDPEVWASLGASRGSCTVREVIARLTRGEPMRAPAQSSRLPLALYPEAHGPFEGYAPTQIQRAAAYLRSRHAATVVDLPNRRPAFTSAEAAVAALWIEQSDAVVLPATANAASLRGVLDYLGSDGVQDKPVIVAYLVQQGRRPRRASPIRALLDEVRRNVVALVDLPDDDTGTEALVHRGTVGPGGNLLRSSHLRLAQAVVQAAVRQPTGARS